MIQGLLWIIGAYMLGAAAVHAAHRRSTRRSDTHGKHYILYSFNDGRHMEWAVRSLLFFCWLQGRSIAITVIDEGSTDDTLAIIHSLSRHVELQFLQADAGTHQSVFLSSQPADHTDRIHIRLRHPDDLRKLPLQYKLAP